MEPWTIGDLTFEPSASCLCVTMATHPFATFWSVVDVEAAITALQRWRETQVAARAAHGCPWCGEPCWCTHDFSCQHGCAGARRVSSAGPPGPAPDKMAPCPRCREPSGIMTCTDLTTTGGMVYRIRCYACRYTPKWSATQAEAHQRWQRARRTS
jgi:hypothetical protein